MPDRPLLRTMLQLVPGFYLPVVFLATGFSAAIPGTPTYLVGLGATPALVGIILAVRTSGNVVADLPGGFAVARIGPRAIAIGASLAAGLSSLVLAAADNLLVFALASAVRGSSTSMLLLASLAEVRLRIPAETRGRALASAGGAIRIGGLIGPAVGGLLAQGRGMPSVFMMQAVLSGLAAISITLDRGYTRGPLPESQNPDGTRARLLPAMHGRWRATFLIATGIGMLQLIRLGRSVFVPLAGEAAGMSVAEVGYLLSVSGFIELLLVPVAGSMMDRSGRRTAGMLCLGLMVLGLGLLSGAGVPLVVAGAVILIGIGNGFGAGINMTVGSDLAPQAVVGEFLGIWRVYADGFGMLGPAVVGALTGLFGLPVALVSLAGLGGIGFVALARAPEPRDIEEILRHA